MSPEDVVKIEQWFSVNAESYIKNHPDNSEEYRLKRNHTFRVKEAIEKISDSMKFSNEILYSAKAAALLHDTGRFRQFAEYNTFSDALSEDHAELGLKIIQESKLLNDIDRQSANRIIFAVRNHNKYKISPDKDNESVILAKMLRDADKIDIFNIVADYYTNSESEKIAGMLNLPNNKDISEAVCIDIFEGRIPKLTDIKSCNDLKLLQMSWIFDMNFPVSLEVVKEKKYLDLIFNTLPLTKDAADIYNHLTEYLNNKTSQTSC